MIEQQDNTTRPINRAAVRRRRWLMVHRVVGLTAGAILVVLGITGSLLVFWQDLDAWLNPHLFKVERPKTGPPIPRPMGDIVEDLLPARRHHRLSGGGVVVPATPRAKTPFEFAQYHVFVDPYTADVLGIRLVRPAGLAGSVPRTFIGFVFALHYALLLP